MRSNQNKADLSKRTYWVNVGYGFKRGTKMTYDFIDGMSRRKDCFITTSTKTVYQHSHSVTL